VRQILFTLDPTFTPAPDTLDNYLAACENLGKAEEAHLAAFKDAFPAGCRNLFERYTKLQSFGESTEKQPVIDFLEKFDWVHRKETKDEVFTRETYANAPGDWKVLYRIYKRAGYEVEKAQRERRELARLALGAAARSNPDLVPELAKLLWPYEEVKITVAESDEALRALLDNKVTVVYLPEDELFDNALQAYPAKNVVAVHASLLRYLRVHRSAYSEIVSRLPHEWLNERFELVDKRSMINTVKIHFLETVAGMYPFLANECRKQRAEQLRARARRIRQQSPVIGKFVDVDVDVDDEGVCSRYADKGDVSYFDDEAFCPNCWHDKRAETEDEAKEYAYQNCYLTGCVCDEDEDECDCGETNCDELVDDDDYSDSACIFAEAIRERCEELVGRVGLPLRADTLD
jgi:hypothetical protein